MVEQEHTESVNNEIDEDDDRKVFCSRVPSSFDENVLRRILEEHFGIGCVGSVMFVYKKNDEEKDDTNTDENSKDSKKENEDYNNKLEKEHKGFAFVVFDTIESRDNAVEKGTVRGGVKTNSKKKHTIYIRPIVRDGEPGKNEKENIGGDGICFLWKNYRCPYGDNCKFSHVGDGGCKEIVTDGKNKKNKKCFSFKKKGKCKAGDSCPFIHELGSNKKKIEEKVVVESTNDDKKNKDCINWKTKGKCRKGDRCPYRHDEAVREAFLRKKSKKQGTPKENSEGKKRQPLSVRVFGLNYDTTENDVRDYFKECGPIVEITFPTFEDSGRSKGYCGLLFQSPKAVAKAVEKDGLELHERWLSVQAGKMYLKQWEKRDNERAEKLKREDYEGGEESGKSLVGEYGQKVKKRKTHGFKTD